MDPCWLCQCRGGISFCSKAECAELDCENFYIPEGECCPVCIGTHLHRAHTDHTSAPRYEVYLIRMLTAVLISI